MNVDLQNNTGVRGLDQPVTETTDFLPTGLDYMLSDTPPDTGSLGDYMATDPSGKTVMASPTLNDTANGPVTPAQTFSPVFILGAVVAVIFGFMLLKKL